MVPKIYLIAAACENMGIGVNGGLPWRLKSELSYFSRMTKATEETGKQNAVVMGRKTWECIPENRRPLPNRLNVVLTRQQNQSFGENVIVSNSLEAAIETLNQPPLRESIEKIWIIGGSSVYKEAMESENCYRVYLTRIMKNFECDTFLPSLGTNFTLVKDPTVPEELQEENGIKFKYEVYEKV